VAITIPKPDLMILGSLLLRISSGLELVEKKITGPIKNQKLVLQAPELTQLPVFT